MSFLFSLWSVHKLAHTWDIFRRILKLFSNFIHFIELHPLLTYQMIFLLSSH